MTQLIIVYIIVATAISYTFYSLVKNLKVKSTGSCGDDCGCSAKTDIKRMLKDVQKKKVGIVK